MFEKLFVTGEADIVAEFYARNKEQAPDAPTLQKLEKTLESKTGLAPVGVAFDNQLNISIDHQKLLLYNISYEEVYRYLRRPSRKMKSLLYALINSIYRSR